jgi:hypothetical protein
MEEIQYKEGFNNGYLLAKYEPNISDQLPKDTHSPNLYLQGFFSGKDEFEKSNVIEQEMQNLETIRAKGRDDRELGR